LLYKPTQVPVGRRDRSPGLASTSANKLHPGPRSAANGSSRKVPEKCNLRPKQTTAGRPRGSHPPPTPDRKPESPTPTSRVPPFTTAQFHVLLNSLFKVLFNFPSRYLFAIGLGVIFSLTWSLPRTLSCTPKQLDSRGKPAQRNSRLTGLSPSMGCGPSQGGLGPTVTSRGGSPKHHIPRDRGGRRFGAGLCPFHSPLLRASRLFSFPPLINMLKFGGSPCLLSGRKISLGSGVSHRGEGYSKSSERPDPRPDREKGGDPGFLQRVCPRFKPTVRPTGRGNNRMKRLGATPEREAQCPPSSSRRGREGCKTDPEPDMDNGQARVRNMRSKCRCSYVLQFTFRRAVCCVLHRPPSQVIHCVVLSLFDSLRLPRQQSPDSLFLRKSAPTRAPRSHGRNGCKFFPSQGGRATVCKKPDPRRRSFKRQSSHPGKGSPETDEGGLYGFRNPVRIPSHGRRQTGRQDR
jgi:hypothetical protein